MWLTNGEQVVSHHDLHAEAQRSGKFLCDIIKEYRPHFEPKKLVKSSIADQPEWKHFEYNTLTKDVCAEKDTASFGKDMRLIDRQLTMAFNLVLSVGATFFAVFYFSHSFSDVARVLMGIAASIIVATAELYFLLRDLSKEDQLIAKQK
jgi:hypothetical protein